MLLVSLLHTEGAATASLAHTSKELRWRRTQLFELCFDKAILPGTNVQGTGLLSGGHLIPKLLGNLAPTADATHRLKMRRGAIQLHHHGPPLRIHRDLLLGATHVDHHRPEAIVEVRLGEARWLMNGQRHDVNPRPDPPGTGGAVIRRETMQSFKESGSLGPHPRILRIPWVL